MGLPSGRSWNRIKLRLLPVSQYDLFERACKELFSERGIVFQYLSGRVFSASVTPTTLDWRDGTCKEALGGRKRAALFLGDSF
jgi:hypothetical protein